MIPPLHLPAIEHLTATLFGQRWQSFLDDEFLNPDLRYPGVYLLAYSRNSLKGRPVKEADVLYVGMSNAQGGVRSRLIQFRNGIEKYGTHSGAMRFYREYQKNIPHSRLKNPQRFFFTALSIKCVSDKGNVTAKDLRALGHVACLEYYAIARIRNKTDRPPPLNKFGKRQSPA